MTSSSPPTGQTDSAASLSGRYHHRGPVTAKLYVFGQVGVTDPIWVRSLPPQGQNGTTPPSGPRTRPFRPVYRHQPGCTYLSSASRTFASCRSLVSKPSVNQS